jgi:anaerobic magnesium-protoporphyrin IX monomethyl ester cyclase
MRVAFVNVNKNISDTTCRELDFFVHKCAIELGLLFLDANVTWQPHDATRHFNLQKMSIERRSWLNELRTFAPDVVALSALSFYAPSLTMAVALVKEHTEAVTIIGGPHANSVGAALLEDPSFDYVCVGEGEDAFRGFIDAHRQGVSPDKVPGISYRAGAQIYTTPPRVIADLATVQWPDDRHFAPAEYAGFTSQLNLKIEHVPITTSRGCPYRCIYCHEIMGKKVRFHSPERILEYVDYWRARGVHTFYFNDDIFNINRERLKTVFGRLAQRPGVRVAFPNGVRADLLDDSVVDAMVEGGTFFAVLAVESASSRIQRLIRKNLNLDRTYQAAARFGHHGIILGSFNILGFPGETEDEIERTIAFNSSLPGLNKAAFFILNPHPGTVAYEMALAEGYRPPDMAGGTNGYFNQTDSSPTRHVTAERLRELWRKAYECFYLDNARISRIITGSNPNLDDARRLEFHQVDYSYVLRQALGVTGLDQVPPTSGHEQLVELLPDGPLARY